MSRWPPKLGGIPVKLVFDGIQSGSPEARALYNLLQGPINQFYQKASQTHANSGLPSQYLQQHLSGGAGHIRYSNIYGQETLHVKAAPEVIKQAQKQVQQSKEPKKPWDWAFFELVVPVSASAPGVVLRAKRRVPLPQEAGITNNGVIYDNRLYPDNVDGLTPPVASYPNYWSDGYEFSESRSNNKQTSTLYVDLRRFNGGPVVFDIYGYLDVAANPEQVQVGYYGPEMQWDGGEVRPIQETEYTYHENSGTLTLLGPPPQQYFEYSENGVWRDGSVNPYVSMFVHYQDAPLAPLTMIPGAPERVSGQSNTDPYFIVDFGMMRTRHEEIVYDSASGMVTSLTAYSVNWAVTGDTISLEPERIWGGKVSVQVSWSRSIRTVEPGMGTVYTPIPASVKAEARLSGGDGKLDPKRLYVNNGLNRWVEYCIESEGAPIKVPTARLRNDVPISGPPPEKPNTDLIGTLVIDPMTRSAAFNLP